MLSVAACAIMPSHRTEAPVNAKSKGQDVGITPSPYSDLLGLSKAEILSRMGEPTSKNKNTWTYKVPLGRGMHSFQHENELMFEKDKVIKVIPKEIPVGCIIIE